MCCTLPRLYRLRLPDSLDTALFAALFRSRCHHMAAAGCSELDVTLPRQPHPTPPALPPHPLLFAAAVVQAAGDTAQWYRVPGGRCGLHYQRMALKSLGDLIRPRRT